MTRDLNHDQRHASQPVRRPYRSPQLLVYGAMRDLTAGGSGNTTEDKDQHPAKSKP
jgi:hypothetical protein